MDAREGDEGGKESKRDEGEGHQKKKKKIFSDWEERKDESLKQKPIFLLYSALFQFVFQYSSLAHKCYVYIVSSESVKSKPQRF